MTAVTVPLEQHHVNAIIDARVRLTLLSQLGVDMSLICDALDEVVQMCVENRSEFHSVHADSAAYELEAIRERDRAEWEARDAAQERTS